MALRIRDDGCVGYWSRVTCALIVSAVEAGLGLWGRAVSWWTRRAR
ncbi:MAG: hypothetical protein AAGI54_00655 [Planctomycetota bacterium]